MAGTEDAGLVNGAAPVASFSDESEVGPMSDGLGSQSAVGPPALQGRHVILRPVTQNDYGPLQALELSSDLAFRWRYRGKTPSPEQWTQGLWQGVLAQYLVVGRCEQRPLGLVLAYKPNFQDGYAFVGVARLGAGQRSPLAMLGFGLFIDYVFKCWDFRKLYLETPEYNYGQFASGAGRHFQVEGRLREHSFFDGKHWDYLTLAIYRDTWAERTSQLVAVERPRELRRVRVRIPPLPERT